MKKLDVPYLPQKQEKDCLVACLKMVMDFHGKQYDYDTILNKLSFYSMGLSLQQIGKYAVENDFDANIISLNPHLFNTGDIGKSQDDILEKIRIRSKDLPDFKEVSKYLTDYMEAGGKISPAILTKHTIIHEIDAERPVIIQLATRVIHGHDDGFNFHANVVTGYDNDHFIVNDPARPNRGGGSHSIHQDLIMNSIMMNAYADLDNAAILTLKPTWTP